MWIGRGRAPLLRGEHLATSSRVARRIQRLALDLLHLRDRLEDEAAAVGEDEEGGAVRLEAGGVERDGVGDGAHTVLAHTVADVALGGGVLLEVAELLHERHVGGREIRGAADEAGDGGACLLYTSPSPRDRG